VRRLGTHGGNGPEDKWVSLRTSGRFGTLRIRKLID
jgi:hypothetical protein